MWMFFAVGAVVMAILNLCQYMRRKPAKWFRFLSLALTALTLCSFYSQVGVWIAAGDWAAMEDVVPFMSKALWVVVSASVVVNGISLFEK